jgi:hemerythrin
MSAITWSDDLSVGHRIMDAQHKGLISLINRFGADQLTPAEMGSGLEALIAYAAKHFNAEEKFIMRAAPEILGHQIECHAKFIETAYDFAHRFHAGEGEALRDKVYAFLCDWLIRHIREEDQQYNKKKA